MASTPPPPSPSSLRVPGAPLHGAGYDQFSPYPTRQSTRLAKQRAVRGAEITPPPICPNSPSKARSSASPKKYQRVKVDEETLSSPGTSSCSNPSADISKESRRFNSTHDAYDPFDMSASHHVPSSTPPHSRTAVNQALPTPAKTPSKKKVDHFSSASRTLFPTHTMSPKKPAPFSPESLEAPTSGKKEIQIYTDSRDRIPKASQFATPFAAGPSSSTGPRFPRDVETYSTDASGLGPPSSAVRRRRDARRTPDDQMTMIFRGKKVIQTFDGDEDAEGDELGLFAARPDLLEGNEDLLNSVKPLSRDSIKPRQLFEQRENSPPLCGIVDKAVDDDSSTDTEDEKKGKKGKPSDSPLATSLSPEFPQAPGATRLTRSSTRGSRVEETPTANIASQTKRKRISPFDQWLRKKQKPEDTATAAQGTQQKASSGPTSPTTPRAAKKTRSNRSA